MQRILVVSALVFSLAGVAKAQTAQPGNPARTDAALGNRASAGPETTGTNAQIEEIKKELMKANQERRDSLRRKDKAAALATFADDWAYTNERGETYSKEQWVEDRIDGNLTFPYFEHVDVEWHVFGDSTVVETGRSNSILVYKGKVSHGPRRETAVYVKINGKWVWASLHVGFIPAEQRDFTFPASALPH